LKYPAKRFTPGEKFLEKFFTQIWNIQKNSSNFAFSKFSDMPCRQLHIETMKQFSRNKGYTGCGACYAKE
jgi:hypothetical protein